jgi:hypothetical protein
MRHPAEGLLRRLLDEPAGVADRDRRHVAGCPHCLDGLAAMREDAVLVGAALAPRGPRRRRRRRVAAPVDGATAPPRGRGGGAARARRARRSRALLRRPAAAALAVAAVLTGTGVAAASGWLEIFRTEQVAPVSLSTADLIALPDLSAYGEVEVTGEADVRQVPRRAAAARRTGLDVPRSTPCPAGSAASRSIRRAGR